MTTSSPHRDADTPTLDLLECLIDHAGSYFRLRNFAHATRRGYLSDQLIFVRYLKGTRGVSSVTEVERAHIIEYLRRLSAVASEAERGRESWRRSHRSSAVLASRREAFSASSTSS